MNRARSAKRGSASVVVAFGVVAAGVARTRGLGAALEALLDELEIDRAVMVGPSFGGGRILDAVGLVEARFAGVVLVAPAGTLDPEAAPIEVPALLLWAEDDDVVPVERAVPLGERFVDSSVQFIRTGGHSVWRENPDWFHERLDDWLAELP